MKIALLFGINYTNTPDVELRGCVEDVKNMSKYLKDVQNFDKVKTYTDEDTMETTRGQNIIHTMYKTAIQTWREKIDVVYFHLSGHGTQIRDYSYDENDGYDECFVPSDYKKNGVITDDLFKRIFKYFHKNTKVICVFDCCHSGTIGDLSYKWSMNGEKIIQNKNSKCRSNIITISGCMDEQTSADAYNVLGKRKFTGALTSCMLMILEDMENNDIGLFQLIYKTRSKLTEKGFTQIPQICSSFDLDNYTRLF